jgi:TPP-dependent 2-oxoacid decarboxylase
VVVKHHCYERVRLGDFMQALAARLTPRLLSSMDIVPSVKGCVRKLCSLHAVDSDSGTQVHKRHDDFKPEEAKKLTFKRLFNRLSHAIPENAMVVVETGAAMCGSGRLFLFFHSLAAQFWRR